MPFKRWKCSRVSVAVMAVVAASATVPDAASAADPEPLESCFWVGPATAGNLNVNFPDEGAAYWYARYTLPPGAKVVLRGEYARARYQSLNSYGVVGGRAGTPTDALNDVATQPDAGSANPYLAGARRNALRRSYTVTVLGEPRPADAASRTPNTLYAGTGTSPQVQELIYRVYVADKNRDVAGDTGLPRPEVVLVDGTRLSGETACETLAANPGRAVPNLSLGSTNYVFGLRNRFTTVSTHPATDPTRWYAFFNSGRLAEPYLAGTPSAPAIATLPAGKAGGLYSNIDNSYLYNYLDRRLGPDPDGHNVVVLRGRAPTTPRTLQRTPRMGEGQVRYWSICQNESLATTAYSDCLYDEQIPVDRDGFYTIVMSLEGDRPANAARKCGVAWLDWGMRGDGVDPALGRRETFGHLIYRQQLPAPSFAQAIVNVPTPGAEPQTLGDYLPQMTYMTPAQFAERHGCPTPRNHPPA